MFENYIKVAFRNLMKHRGYTIINITGLTLGMLCCLLIMLWVQDELSYDGFHKNSDQLYIVVHKNENGWSSSSPWAMAPALKNDFPEIEKASRVSTQNLQVKYIEQNFYENVAFVDPDFLEMFTFPLLQGDPASVLNVRQSAVISEKIAKKYFRNENPIGKYFQINLNTNLTVTGIIKDIPSNSSFSFDILVPIINLGEDRLATWSSEAPAYVMLRKNANVERLRAKMAGTINKYDKRLDNSKITDDIFPNSRLHLYGLNGNGSISNVFIFSAIAIIVLIVACINFINLVTAKASIRGKEIGMRKVLGADKKHIIWQFWGETLVLSIVAFVLAFVLALIILPYFNILADKHLTINFRSPALILSSLSIILLTSIVACSYPVLLFSSFRPIKVLKESFSARSKKTNIRWTLVVIQFTVSIILIVMAITMNRQFNYIQNRNLGFNREQVIVLPINEEFGKQYETIKNYLLQYPNITHITSSSHSPNNINYSNPVYWEGRGPDQYESMSYDVVDYDYLETFEIKLSQGRNFSKEFSTDQQNYIVNEAAVAFMKMDSPIGNMFSIWQNEGKIIGVVKDFHSVSLHDEIPPVVMTLTPYMPPTQVFIRIKPGNIHASLSTIENTWKKFVSNYPFQYEFLDDVFRRQYNDEKKIKTLLQIFSALAVFISCIGLFGLAVFVTQRRNKEIGIRKIAGANVLEITGLIFQDFAKWLLFAIVFSIPIAWLIMHKWLENFAYKTELSWWIFALAGLLALGIALLTVSWQSWKAATRNPVEALRYE